VNEKFANLSAPRRIWAIASIHGDIERLCALHDHIAQHFLLRDRLVYLGNYLGVESRTNADVVDELLAFRAALLGKPGIEPDDIVHLRGPAEEAWQRLLRLQFAPVPLQTLDKLMASGVEAYLRLYGVSLNDTRSMARAGSMAITRWTNQLRALQRIAPGHEALTSSMRRAAFSKPSREPPYKGLLFVPAGFDSTRSLDDQGDALWWSAAPFGGNVRSQTTYARIVRGFDSVNSGPDLAGEAVTLDGGCGRGGPLVAGCFAANGKLLDLVTVGGTGAMPAIKPFAWAANEDYEEAADTRQSPAALPGYGLAASA
jgi:hypothetical protein